VVDGSGMKEYGPTGYGECGAGVERGDSFPCVFGSLYERWTRAPFSCPDVQWGYFVSGMLTIRLSFGLVTGSYGTPPISRGAAAAGGDKSDDGVGHPRRRDGGGTGAIVFRRDMSSRKSVTNRVGG